MKEGSLVGENFQGEEEGYTIRPEAGIRDEDMVKVPSNGMGTLEEILMVGAGTSTCVPNVACLARKIPNCLVCLDAVGRLERTAKYTREHGGPPPGVTSRNQRTNPSAILRYRHSDKTLHSILIDCGKSFYTNAVRTILKGGVRKLDGLLLTHGHADAILGLDDLRHWAGHSPAIQQVVNVWCDKVTFKVIQSTFPYLVNPKCATGGGEVSTLSFHLFTPGETFHIGELSIEPISVFHGEHMDGRPYYANGFRINGLLYLSDISGIPPESHLKLVNTKPELLIADCLFESGNYKSHYCWPQTRELIKLLAPRLTVLVGMAHTIDYYSFQRHLDIENGINLAGDGIISKIHYDEGRILVGFDSMLLRFIPSTQS